MIEKEWEVPELGKGPQVEDDEDEVEVEIEQEKSCQGLKSWTRRICPLSIPG
jgi:hypothetical protein